MNATKITGRTCDWIKYHEFFKIKYPTLWSNGCPNELIWDFIVLSRMIAHYEFIDLPSRQIQGTDDIQGIVLEEIN